jgi:Cd2+/Zn2+-exporting ATPase
MHQTLEIPVSIADTENCAECAKRLRSRLGVVRGVAAAELDKAGRQLRLAYDPTILSLSALEAHVREASLALTRRFRHATLQLEGLDCPECAGAVEHSVTYTPGVLRAEANFAAASLHVEYDAEVTDLGRIMEAVSRTGYRALVPGAASAALVVRVAEMDCQDEVRAIEGRLRALAGVGSWQVNLLERTIHIQFEPASITAETILSAIRGLGMTAELASRVARAVVWWRDPLLLSTAASGLFLVSAFVGDWLEVASTIGHGLHGAALCAGGWVAARKAVGALLARRLDMNVLMTVAVLGAVSIGQWDEAATVAFLFALAQLLERYSLDRARQAVRRLLSVAPTDATVQRDGKELRIPVAAITTGEIIVVRPGERVPLDGIVRSGISALNQAPITGESMPVKKAPGAQVFAGSINGEGALEIEVTHRAQETMLARIIALVEEAQAQKAPTQTLVERFAAIYTPAVIAGAVLIAALPPLLSDQPAWPWIYRALVLLVISCPCALVISTPVAVVCALARATRTGILIKGGRFLEALGALRALALDKTGTLTRGRPTVAEIRPLAGLDAREVLRLASAVEARSEHPVAAAILQSAREQGIAWPEATDFRAVTGRGALARLDGFAYHVGSHRYMEELGVCDGALEAILGELESRGQTPVVLSNGSQVLGVLGVADQIREGAAESLKALRRLGIRPLVMLTGDVPETAKAIGRQVGADQVCAQLLPDEKVKAIQDLVRRHGTVGMVGDGINDAPALAAATVGIAMGAEGTDAAIETADVALMRDDLRQLPVAVSLGRRAVRIIRTNIFFSLVTKATFVLLAMLGQATLWMAVAADMGTSLLVTLNGMRLLRGDPGTPNAPLWVSELPAAGPKTGSSCDCCDNK